MELPPEAGSGGEPKLTSNMRFRQVITPPREDPLANHPVKPRALCELPTRFAPGPRPELPEGANPHGTK